MWNINRGSLCHLSGPLSLYSIHSGVVLITNYIDSYIYFLLLQTIIFIRDKNPRGQEISGYIDYAHRLKTEDFEPYFSGKKRLIPRPSDLRLVLYVKPGACRHLSFATNVLSNFIFEIIFLMQFNILVPNYSEVGYFFKIKQILA